MLKKSVFIFSVAVSLVSGATFAKGTTSLSCSDILAPVLGPAATAFAYEVSEFEALYVEILKDAALSAQVPQDQAARYAENFFKKKAEFLNQATYIVRQMIINKMNGEKSPTTPEQVYSMIGSLGVDPGLVGLLVNEQQLIELPTPRMRASAPQAAAPQAEPEDETQGFVGFIDPRGRDESADEAQGFIGFNDPKGSNARDLPDHLSRAIGFGRSAITRESGPSRPVAGGFAFHANEKARKFVVLDSTGGILYSGDLDILTATGGSTGDKIMHLRLNQRTREWFISFENTANPEGIIGFAMPKK